MKQYVILTKTSQLQVLKKYITPWKYPYVIYINRNKYYYSKSSGCSDNDRFAQQCINNTRSSIDIGVFKYLESARNITIFVSNLD